MGPSSKQLRIPATTGTTETTLQHTKPRDEILSAHAPHTAPCNETFTAPARHKQPEFTHFHHAGANFLSQHTPCTHHTPTPGRHFFQPTGAQHCEPTGTNRKELPATSPRQWGKPPRKVARNSIGRSFNKVRKRCNSNDLNSMFERVAGELRAKLGVDSAAMCARAGHEACGAKARSGRVSRRSTEPPISDTAPPVWRAPEGPAAVPVGGGGAWPGFETTRQTRQQRPGTTGVEGAGGTGGHGRASRRGAERSEVAKSRGRPGPPAPGTPVAPQATPQIRRRSAGITRPRGGQRRA